MINTDDESNYWPWKWIHDGKECKTQEDFRNAWLSVDLLNDKTLRTREHKYFNSRGSELSRQVSKNIFCNHDEFKVTENISVADYQDYTLKKFDLQMAKIAEMGPMSISLSGGVDSAIIFAWAIKNKVDLKLYTWLNNPWQGSLNSVMTQKILDMTKSVNMDIDVLDYNDYENDVDSWLIKFCDAELFDMPMDWHELTSGWMNMTTRPTASNKFYDKHAGRIKVSGYSTDELFLHRETTYSRLMPKPIVKWLVSQDKTPVYMANQGYRIGGMWGKEWSPNIMTGQGKQVMAPWDASGFLGHLREQGGTCPASSKEWAQAWHNIKPHSCTAEQFEDIINVGWLKEAIRKWTCDDVANNVHSVACEEKYYTMKPELQKYMVAQANKFSKILQERGMANQASYWAWWSTTLAYLNTLPYDVCEQVHTINWLLKNTKHS